MGLRLVVLAYAFASARAASVVLSARRLYVEESGRATYTVSLSQTPTAHVDVHFTNGDAALVRTTTKSTTSPSYTIFASGQKLRFTVEDHAPKTVTLISVANDDESGNYFNDVTITHSVTSSDAAFSNADFDPSKEVTLRIYDDDTCLRDCAAGSYFSLCNNTQTCLDCPAGFYCGGGCGPPAACGAGTFNSATAADSIGDCTACGAGTYALNAGSPTCSVCPEGHACATGAASPVACLSGFSAPAGAAACEACPRGAYAPAGSRECTRCPRGFACPDSAGAEPEPCSPASYALGAATNCTVCPAGSACPSAASEPVACEGGSYSLENWGFCVVCPSGFGCNSTAAVPHRCGAGEAAIEGATFCSICPRGTFANGTAFERCSICPRGHTCQNSRNAPAPCSAGKFSGLGATDCTDCPTGTYSLESASVFSSCAICPAAHFCPSADVEPRPCPAGTAAAAGYTANCTACPRGTKVSDDGARCTRCPVGFACASPAAGPTACLIGTFAIGGNVTECTPCPRGYACASTASKPQLCERGFSSESGDGSCEPCRAGQSCASPEVDARFCDAGYYALNASDSCEPCPAGFSCESASRSPVACEAGTFSVALATNCADCPAGSQCHKTDEAPAECARGQYSLGNATTCLDCPAGKFCESKTVPPLECPYATFSTPLSAACETCPLGFLLAKSYVVNGTGCDPCPAGFACPDAERPEVVIPCSAGTFSVGAALACTACAPGHACPFTDRPTRLPCRAGSFAAGGAAACQPCPAGFECKQTDSAQLTPCAPGMYSHNGDSYCAPCHAGDYCPSPNQAPLPCPAGTFSGSLATNCTICDAGHFCDAASHTPVRCARGSYSLGGAVRCAACAAGYDCPEASTSATPAGAECPVGTYCGEPSERTLCPPGTLGSASAAISEDEACAPCDAGWSCPRLGTTSNTRDPCIAGHFCPQGSPVPEPCPAGTYSDALGRVSSGSCETCPAGYYCPAGATSATKALCPPGYYCPAGAAEYDALPCPAGTFSAEAGLHDSAQCRGCVRGGYCPQASTWPEPCGIGTFNPDASKGHVADCRACEAGWACPTPGAWYVFEKCRPGHYCPAGTAYADQHACAAGTFTDANDLTSLAHCTTCPARGACLAGSTSATVSPCTAGHYCPAGSTVPAMFECPEGTYSSRTNLAAAGECTVCPAGSYCVGGRTAVSGACSIGHYCPTSSTKPKAFKCAAGTWSDRTDNYAAEHCQDCGPGTYCPEASVAETKCPSGTFGPNNQTLAAGPTACATFPSSCASTATTCVTCLAGYSCALGSTEPAKCGVGFYSTAGKSVCTTCAAGFYCGSETTTQTAMLTGGGAWENSADSAGGCFPGTYCPPGTAEAPDLVGDACPAGHYCPQATTAPLDCAAGTYYSLTGAAASDDCLTTPAKYYTAAGSATFTGLCAPGHYCPAGSTTAFQVPCPTATYQPLYGRGTLEDCSVCTSGGSCVAGSAYPAACPRGFYCVTGVPEPSPCPIGTYGNVTGLRRSEDCTPCDAGYFCDGLGLPRPRGPCEPGYYCVTSSYTSAPHAPGSPAVDEPTSIGGRCPAGGYCPLASSWQTACPAGTFSNSTGAASEDDCNACLAGFYCAGSSNPYPSGPCLAGYYCESGSTSPIQFECAAGSSSSVGASQCDECEPGTWQPYRAQSKCEQCPAGYYCADFGETTFEPCPQGYYCPLGTGNFKKYPCPFGMYGAQNQLVRVGECSYCDGGEFCKGAALTQPSGNCEAGYYCSQGAFDRRGDFCIDLDIYKRDYDGDQGSNVSLADATLQSYLVDCQTLGGPCTPGHYCLEKAAYPQPCPLGTYNANSFLDSNCDACDPGFACDDTGLAAPARVCDAGFFCRNKNTGAASARPLCLEAGCLADYGLCPVGHFCGNGTVEPKRCPPATYGPVQGLAKCYTCPRGSYCNQSSTRFFDCPQGYYCPEGTALDWTPCPVGRYGHGVGLGRAEDCRTCPAGFACDEPALQRAGPPCQAGYYCPKGSEDVFGLTEEGDHECPAGHYCLEGSRTPTACLAGTFGGFAGATVLADCGLCTPGDYCDATGLNQTAGPCDGGYACPAGSDTKRPLATVCPAGTHCPVGSANPINCTAGTYSDTRGFAACAVCPAGYGCGVGTADYSQRPCARGHYCPAGSSGAFEVACPLGTWSNLTLASAEDTCVAVPPGSYAIGTGNALPEGLCDAGYYCTGRATRARPRDALGEFEGDDFGGPCSVSSNCPAGSTEDLPCPGGVFCDGFRILGDCAPGYFCTSAAISNTPVGDWRPVGGAASGECPLGHYCKKASATPKACGPGTYLDELRATNVTDCKECLAGFVCPNASTPFPTEPCAPGYFCPAGSVVGVGCPAGTFCAGGNTGPTPCASGSYQSLALQSACLDCPAGAYCLEGVEDYAACPRGHYCPVSTTFATQFPCPTGTFSNWTKRADLGDCAPCLPGRYCDGSGLTAPNGDCAAGFFCTEGAVVKRPPETWNRNTASDDIILLSR